MILTAIRVTNVVLPGISTVKPLKCFTINP
jgi:hypothetical protein